MTELLLPRTDGRALVEVAIVFPTLGSALFCGREDREWRLLVLGLLVCSLAWFGLRALH